MANEVVGVSLVVDGSGAVQSVGSIRKQLRDAQQEATILNEKFGTTSTQAINAAKRVAQLKDQIADARSLVDAFNPDKKFAAFSQSISGVVGGFCNGSVSGAQYCA
jgi:hypothetical protein